MKVIPTTTTVTSYCEEMKSGKIVVNRDYQRSSKVWPTKARSYLIDTILLGFPVPKLSLYQTTDLKSRRTLKEIVDGQQRSMTLLTFWKNDFKITGKSEFSGMTFSQLDDENRAVFLEYQLSLDLFVGATQEEIRQVFRRINSYTVPLSPQELRHATYQGEFKWFMVQLVEQYAQVLKDIGVFTESQLSRMKDASLMTEIIMALEEGIISASEVKLDTFYKVNDDSFDDKRRVKFLLDQAFSYVLEWQDIHKTALLKPYNFYTLMLAIIHCQVPCDSLQTAYPIEKPIKINNEESLSKLGELADALAESERADKKYTPFIKANSEATNRLKQRNARFQFFCDALNTPI